MRRFLITNETKFKGVAEIHYNDKGKLSKVDLSQCEMSSDETIHHFKAAIPVTIARLEAGTAFTGDTIVAEADFEVTFDMFWIAYDKKINKKRTEAFWQKMNKIKQVKAYYGVKPYDKYLSKEGWRTKLDPESYLKNETYENEYK